MITELGREHVGAVRADGSLSDARALDARDVRAARRARRADPRRIEGFTSEHGLEPAAVSVELADGSLHRLATLSPEPGFGFITLCPHCDEGEPRS